MGTRKTREELDAEMAAAEPTAEKAQDDLSPEVDGKPPETPPGLEAPDALAQQFIEPAEKPPIEPPAVEPASGQADSAMDPAAPPSPGSTIERPDDAPEGCAAPPGEPSSVPSTEAVQGRDAEAELLPRMKLICESLLFASGQPLPSQQLLAILRELQPDLSASGLRAVLEGLRTDLREGGRGIRLVEVAGGYQLRTPSESAPFVRRLISRRPPRMTQATIETLAIVAYRQPVTRAEVEDIRGVESGAVLKHLLDRRLVRILGRKEEPGRPLLYGTTKEFLELFSLKDLKSLPTLRDFVELSNEHRAALGLPLMEEAAEPEAEALPGADVLEVEQTAAFTPVGDDEIVQELAVALEELKKRNRNLRALLPVPTEEPDGAAAAPEAVSEAALASAPEPSPADAAGPAKPQGTPDNPEEPKNPENSGKPEEPEETPPPDDGPPAGE
ncbi:MAG: SMC-Scp complex subunit ScpB [Myxococcales bacterium]|nr:SMC-Scp complex subunit ScpB [Myxococcales bacterium]